MQTHSMKRHEMVRGQLEEAGVKETAVLEAMKIVPREEFLPESLQDKAYEGEALYMDNGQTLQKPIIIARMMEALALRGDEKVLEVGTGTGYRSAVLAEIVQDVYTIEKNTAQATQAAHNLEKMDYRNIHIMHKDGVEGWPEEAPFDAILVSAVGPMIPEALKEQVSINGRLVMAVGMHGSEQELTRLTRVSQTEYKEEVLGKILVEDLSKDTGWKEAV